MGTRCQIQWQTIMKDEKGKTISYKAQVYRHSDGYPSAVLEDLANFMEWNKGRNSDASYAAANFIYYMKRLNAERFKSDPEIQKLGYGVENSDEIHGDEEYVYRITAIQKNDSPLSDENFDFYVEYTDLYDIKFEQREKLTFNKVKWKYKITIDKLYDEAINQQKLGN